jgi:hypothetical protein
MGSDGENIKLSGTLGSSEKYFCILLDIFISLGNFSR